MTYIATFYSHFGAIRFKKLCEAQKLPARIMPVPRQLSSSCGTCVRWEGAMIHLDKASREEVEQIAEADGPSYRILYRAAES